MKRLSGASVFLLEHGEVEMIEPLRGSREVASASADANGH
jgi:hypothetical protein